MVKRSLAAKELSAGSTVGTDPIIAVTAGASTIVGKKATGGVVAMTPAEAKTVLAITQADVANLTTDLDNKAAAANAMGTVNHGATGSTARPTGYSAITWVGSATPTNAVDGDVWIDTT